MLKTEDIAEQILYSIVNTPIRDYPFPHQIVKEIVGDRELLELEKNFPRTGSFLPQSVVFNGPEDYSDQSRRVIDLFDLDPSRYPHWKSSDEHKFWNDFRSHLCSTYTANLILKKYADLISKHPFSQRVGKANTDYKFHLMLQSDSSQYEIPPHTQDPIEIFVMIIYLPNSSNRSSSGTSIYRPKSDSFTDIGHGRFNRDDFYLVKTSPYKNKSGICFLKTLDSWHGVELLTGEYLRNSIYFSFGFTER
ncbi:MAG: hypothetical protein VKL39_23800 [Leptolyngbyaceae bacterium]|nr:hypothetical protein [Leptolyngbyaceae bacterium]